MKSHPGGIEHTRCMAALASLRANSKVLDMGAGAGETVEYLRSMGFDAVGIDIEPRSGIVSKADFLSCPYPDESFDAVISQCAFFISENVEKALDEAHRVLKKGGKLLLSDVWFVPAVQAVEKAGFRILRHEDMTSQWREYYIEAIWRGEVCCEVKGKCSYEMLICEKRTENGSV